LPARKKINWEKVREDYESTPDSNRQIALNNRISETAIRKKAKVEKWIKFDQSTFDNLAERQAQAVVEVREIKRTQTYMNPRVVTDMNAVVRTRVQEIEQHRQTFGAVHAMAVEALSHIHEMESEKSRDEKFGPEYFGKLKLGTDVMEKAKINTIGRDPIHDLIDSANDEVTEDEDWAIVVPAQEHDRLKSIDEAEKDE
jgi:hypothetical protein